MFHFTAPVYPFSVRRPNVNTVIATPSTAILQPISITSVDELLVVNLNSGIFSNNKASNSFRCWYSYFATQSYVQIAILLPALATQFHSTTNGRTLAMPHSVPLYNQRQDTCHAPLFPCETHPLVSTRQDYLDATEFTEFLDTLWEDDIFTKWRLEYQVYE
jgi:hypothetical protein